MLGLFADQAAAAHPASSTARSRVVVTTWSTRNSRRSPARSTVSSQIPAVVSGYGSVFLAYFLEGPVRNYDDLLRNDVDLFVGYRRELMKDGIFELPLNLKRSHFSYAHTDEDVDRLLEATEAAVTRFQGSRA